jgi:hypothetical protein
MAYQAGVHGRVGMGEGSCSSPAPLRPWFYISRRGGEGAGTRAVSNYCPKVQAGGVQRKGAADMFPFEVSSAYINQLIGWLSSEVLTLFGSIPIRSLDLTSARPVLVSSSEDHVSQ